MQFLYQASILLITLTSFFIFITLTDNPKLNFMNQIKKLDYVIFKNKVLNVLTGNTPMIVQATNGNTATVRIFIGDELKELEHEVDFSELELFVYGNG